MRRFGRLPSSCRALDDLGHAIRQLNDGHAFDRHAPIQTPIPRQIVPTGSVAPHRPVRGGSLEAAPEDRCERGYLDERDESHIVVLGGPTHPCRIFLQRLWIQELAHFTSKSGASTEWRCISTRKAAALATPGGQQREWPYFDTNIPTHDVIWQADGAAHPSIESVRRHSRHFWAERRQSPSSVCRGSNFFILQEPQRSIHRRNSRSASPSLCRCRSLLLSSPSLKYFSQGRKGLGRVAGCLLKTTGDERILQSTFRFSILQGLESVAVCLSKPWMPFQRKSWKRPSEDSSCQFQTAAPSTQR